MESSTVKWSTIVCISVVNLSLLLSTIAIGTYISVDVNHVCIRFISKVFKLARGPQSFFLDVVCIIKELCAHFEWVHNSLLC